jgi:hypothetical protein
MKMVMRFGTWNVRRLYRLGSLKTISGEIAKYKLDLVGVQEVRWNKGGTEPAGDLLSSMEMGMLIITLAQAFSYIRGSFQQLRG